MDLLSLLFNAYKQLILAPEPLHSFPDYLGCLGLLAIPCLLVVYVGALILKARLIQSRHTLGAVVSVRLAWAWSAVLLMTILLANPIVLWILDRLPDWTSAMPQASMAVLAALLFAFSNYRELRSGLRMMQNVLFESR